MKVSIRQFQALNEIANSGLDDIDKSIELVKAVTGKSQQQIEAMPAKKFNKICKAINSLFVKWSADILKGKPKNYIFVNGKIYKLNYDIYKMSASKYVEGLMFNEDAVKNLHKILATMATPMRWTWKGLKPIAVESENHEELAEVMRDADYDHIYHAMVFFYAVSNEYLMSLDTYGNNQEEKAVVRLLRHSLKFGDGFIKPNWYQNLKGSH